MSQNIKRALSGLRDTYDWDRRDAPREHGQCWRTDSAKEQATRRAAELKAEKILKEYYDAKR